MPLATNTLWAMSESAEKSLVVFIYVALILSTLLVYWQVRNFDFVNYDDNNYVAENPHVLNGLTRDGLVSAFTTAPAGGNWLPLTWISFMLDCQLFGLNPGRIHLVNVLLHLVNTLLLFTVLRKMTGVLLPSAFVAAAFALHPMHVESVAWITERKDVLSTLFLLLTLAAYIGYVKRPSVFRYLIALVLFAFGLMAKPMLVTLPLLLLLLDYWPLGRFDAQSHKPRATRNRGATLYRLIIEKIPFLILAAASSVITFLAQRSGGSMADHTLIPLHGRVANTLVSYAKYIGRMFWPEDMAVFYPFNAGIITLWQVAICILLLLAISILVIRFGRGRKYLPVGWFWFVASLLPVIGLIQSGSQAFADRYTYISYIGLFIVMAWGLPELLSKWSQRKLILGTSAVIALASMGIIAHRQVSYWNNSIALFSHAVEVTQDNSLAYNNRGDAYNKLGRWQEAIEDLSEAIRIRPNLAEAYNGRGVSYIKLGRLQEAIVDFREAIRIKPDYAEAHYNLGVVCSKLGRGTEAIDAYRQAIKIKPDYADAHYNLGLAYSGLGRGAEAIDAYKQAIRIKPDYADAIEDFKQTIKIQPDHAGAYNNLGKAYMILGRGAEAIDAYKQAIKTNPDDAEPHYYLAKELGSQGRYDEAVDQYRTALRLKPDWPACISNLAFLIATHTEVPNRDTNEAIRLAGRACELTKYKNPVCLGTLAAAYASAGRFSEAVDTANKALNLADAANQPQIKNIIQDHLSFYTQGKPYIEPSPKLVPDSNKP